MKKDIAHRSTRADLDLVADVLNDVMAEYVAVSGDKALRFCLHLKNAVHDVRAAQECLDVTEVDGVAPKRRRR